MEIFFKMTIQRLLVYIVFFLIPFHLVGKELTPIQKNYSLPKLHPEKAHTVSSKRITSRLLNDHFKKINLNDSFSNKILENYLEILDFNKNTLTEADVKNIKFKWGNKLDEQLKVGQTQAAYDIFNKVLQLKYQRYEYAKSLLNKKMNFYENDYIILDRHKLNWSKNKQELDDLWLKKVKFDELNLKLSNEPDNNIKKTLADRYSNVLLRLRQTNNEDVFQIYMNAFARQIDPHTSYLSPRLAEQFQSEMSLSLEGIGAVLQQEGDDTIIKSLVKGGPAEKTQKIFDGDRIIGVSDNNGEIKDVIGWRLDDIVSLIKGPKGTKVTLKIYRLNNKKNYIVTVVRDEIKLEDRKAKLEIKTINNAKIGVIEVPSFYVGLTADVKELLRSSEANNLLGLVIDLRNNGGGALSEATTLSGLFIPSGPIVQIKDNFGNVKIKRDRDITMYYRGPLSVLINRYSASASEIFAAVIQDYSRGIIIGTQSYGKGTVQQHRPLNHMHDFYDDSLGYIQYTIQKFYRVNGGSTQNKGVIPDIKFPSMVDPLLVGESVEKNSLKWDSIEPAVYQKTSNFELSELPSIYSKHIKRVKNNDDYNYLILKIKDSKEYSKKNKVSLNINVRKAENKKDDADRLKRINARQKKQNLKIFESINDIPKDYQEPDILLDEAVNITYDLASLNEHND